VFVFAEFVFYNYFLFKINYYYFYIFLNKNTLKNNTQNTTYTTPRERKAHSPCVLVVEYTDDINLPEIANLWYDEVLP